MNVSRHVTGPFREKEGAICPANWIPIDAQSYNTFSRSLGPELMLPTLEYQRKTFFQETRFPWILDLSHTEVHDHSRKLRCFHKTVPSVKRMNILDDSFDRTRPPG